MGTPSHCFQLEPMSSFTLNYGAGFLHLEFLKSVMREKKVASQLFCGIPQNSLLGSLDTD